MNEIQLAMQLSELVGTIFMRIVPDHFDCTHKSLRLLFISKTNQVEIKIDNNPLEMLSLVKSAIFENKEITVIGWNLKNLFTYVLANTNAEFEFSCNIFDLRLAECFVGLRENEPTTFEEAVTRTKRVFGNSSWAKFKSVYQKVYLPLMTHVIPKIETCGVFEFQKRRVLFPYYQIEGQVNGRMSCNVVSDNCFNPHLLDEAKKNSMVAGNGLSFISFDYCFMEVCILAWLSKDEVLLDLVLEGDFYKKLFKLVLDKECETESHRSFCKDILFLPVVYGQAAITLAGRAKIKLDMAERLILKLKELFSKLFEWVEHYPGNSGMYEDYLGRKRSFVAGEEYKYRNFIVQSPAAIFCLEKLVCLNNDLANYAKLAAHIYDGYVVAVEDKQVEMVKSLCIKSLESESNILQGLKLRCNYKISKTLA